MKRNIERISFPAAPDGRAIWGERASRFCCSGLVFLATMLGISTVQAQNPPTEFEVKAAYLYQFGKFVEWPESALDRGGENFTICTLGAESFGSIVDKIISGRTVKGRKVDAKHVSGANDLDPCNVLFISSTEKAPVAEILKLAQSRDILTVGETSTFLSDGGMFRFEIEQHKVRFDVNLAAVQGANLKVSSELLKVAKLVKE